MMAKEKQTAGRPIMSWTFTYEDLARVVDKSVNSIQASRRRAGGFNPDSLESLVLWIARNAPPDFKVEILKHASSIPLIVDAKKRRKTAKR